MISEKRVGQGSGGKRSILKDILPLGTPLGIYIFPIYSCNFKCKYCLCSLENSKRGLKFHNNVMDFSLFKKCVDDISGMDEQLKMLRFAGIGEPLLHKNIAEMVNYAVNKKISNSVEIITNGSMLDQELSDKLIDAGLSRLFISIQGLNSATYKEISEVEIDFKKFIENIKYFYEHRKNTRLHIKILDCSLKDGEEEQFYEMFGNICDTITIERVAPLVNKVDYSSLIPEGEAATVRGNEFEDIDICPLPFYLMQINPDGTVIPCCSAEGISPIGDCNIDSVKKIWTGKRFNDFRKRMLNGCKFLGENNVCSKCVSYKYSIFDEDKINAYDAQNLKQLY